VDAFFENAQRIFEVAQADDSGESNDFLLLVRPDGGLHFVMESALSPDAVASQGECSVSYRVTKTGRGAVRVTGRCGTQQCIFEQHARQSFQPSRELLRDQPLYRINSPLTLSAAS
jgi:hypothetical protein